MNTFLHGGKTGVLVIAAVSAALLTFYLSSAPPNNGTHDDSPQRSDVKTESFSDIKSAGEKAGGFQGFQGAAGSSATEGERFQATNGDYSLEIGTQKTTVKRKDNKAAEMAVYRVAPDRDTPMQGSFMHVETRSADYRGTSSVVIEMLGTDGAQKLSGEDEMTVGEDAGEQWQNQIPRYGKVRAEQVYPGVDIVYYQEEGLFEFDYQIAPGVDASVIAFKVNGAESINKGVEGELLIDTGDNSSLLQMKPPLAYQWVDGVRKRVDSQYQLSGDEVRFEVGSYDSRLPLIIDPIIY